MQIDKIKLRAERDKVRRDAAIEKTREENAMRAARINEMYDPANVKLAIEERMHRDMSKPSELMRKAAATESLRVILRQREKKLRERIQRKNEKIRKVNKEEAFRLVNFANDLNIKLHGSHSSENI